MDVSKVTNFEATFAALNFDADISGWNTESADYMQSMFEMNGKFNQDLSGWCVPLIDQQPINFDQACHAWTLPNSRPDWGKCP
jgi:hypothetical protein